MTANICANPSCAYHEPIPVADTRTRYVYVMEGREMVKVDRILYRRRDGSHEFFLCDVCSAAVQMVAGPNAEVTGAAHHEQTTKQQEEEMTMEQTTNSAASVLTDGLDGMTLRDYFAAKAVQGMLACSHPHEQSDEHMFARDAYTIADAMLKTREIET